MNSTVETCLIGVECTAIAQDNAFGSEGVIVTTWAVSDTIYFLIANHNGELKRYKASEVTIKSLLGFKIN